MNAWKQRAVALLLLVGVLGAITLGRTPARAVSSSRATISAPSHTLELPPAIAQAKLVIARVATTLAIAEATPLVSTRLAAPLYLRNRTLLL